MCLAGGPADILAGAGTSQIKEKGGKPDDFCASDARKALGEAAVPASRHSGSRRQDERGDATETRWSAESGQHLVLTASRSIAARIFGKNVPSGRQQSEECAWQGNFDRILIGET